MKEINKINEYLLSIRNRRKFSKNKSKTLKLYRRDIISYDDYIQKISELEKNNLKN